MAKLIVEGSDLEVAKVAKLLSGFKVTVVKAEAAQESQATEATDSTEGAVEKPRKRKKD